jgi:iron complex transport system ATP-binding protein
VALKDGKIVREGATAEIIDHHVLQEVYGMDIQIEEINDHKICVYFT